MNPHSQEQNSLKPILDFQHQFNTSIRRQQRTTEITKLRMRNLMVALEPKQQQEYATVNDHQFQLSEVPTLFQYLFADSDERVIFGLIGLRKLLAEHQNLALVEEILSTEVYDTIFKMAQNPRSLKKQVQANWILANIATGRSQHIEVMLNKGILEHITRQFNREILAIDEEIIYLVGNIAGTGEAYMEMFINNGTLKQIINIYNKVNNAHIKKSSLWVICSILTVNKPMDEEIIQLASEILIGQLQRQHQEDRRVIYNDIAWSLWKMSSKSKFACLIILKKKVVIRLIQLAEIEPSLVLSCIRIVGNLTLKLDWENNVLIELGVLQYLANHLHNPEAIIRKQSCWVLSNFSAGTKIQSQEMFKNKPMMERLEFLFFNDTIDVRVNAAWALSNFMAKIDAELVYPLFERIIPGFMNLCQDDKNINAIDIGLKGIQNYLILSNHFGTKQQPQFLKNFEVIAKIIYHLQSHPSKIISNKVSSLVDNFIEVESDDEDGMFV